MSWSTMRPRRGYRAAPPDAMPELQTVPDLLGKAESAAATGDFAAADEWLRAIARIQEDELGPLDPELASTLNNLAIVAEKTGRIGDAETFYRRAVAIASVSLSPDDPMLAAGRQNLEDFCRAHGVPIEGPAVIEPPAGDSTPELQAFLPESSHADAKTSAGPKAPDSHIDVREAAASLQRSPASRPSPAPHASPVTWRSRSFATIAIVMGLFVLGALFVMRPGASREGSAPTSVPASPASAPQTSEPARPQVREAAPQPSVPPDAERAQPPPPAPAVDSRAAEKPRVLDSAPAPVEVVTAQLCRTLSTTGGWQCEPAGDPAAPGPLVFYTRVKSPRETMVIHRWYRGATLRRSVELGIRANANDGYRTFSRQTVNAGEEWRLEVRSASGDLLNEQRVSVR
jgi:hypothetical protein